MGWMFGDGPLEKRRDTSIFTRHAGQECCAVLWEWIQKLKVETDKDMDSCSSWQSILVAWIVAS